MNLTYTVKNGEKFDNIKQILKNKFEISDRLLTKLKHSKKIFLNEVPSSIYSKVETNDSITVLLDFQEDNSNIVSTEMNLNIIYEDEFMLIINKPAGLPVHPSMLHYSNSLSNGIKYYYDSINLNKKIRPVNRLDKDTSGIVIFAKNEYIQECLVRQMKTNTFKKEYIAVCNGMFENKEETINAPIARKEGSIIERCVDQEGETSITHYKVIKENSSISVLNILLETGRTHQIRVHMSYIGHPIIGDTLYGIASDLINRQALHSYKVSFIHPVTRKKQIFIAPLYEDMKNIVEKI